MNFVVSLTLNQCLHPRAFSAKLACRFLSVVTVLPRHLFPTGVPVISFNTLVGMGFPCGFPIQVCRAPFLIVPNGNFLDAINSG